MNDLEKLKEFLAPEKPTRSTSTVVNVEGRNLFVMERGYTRLANILPGDASSYKAGDRVILEGGIVVGRASIGRSKVLYL